MRLGPKCPSEEEQGALLRRAGLEDFSKYGGVYIDRDDGKRRLKDEKPDLRQRRELIKATREGDEVVVAYEGIIGFDQSDTLFALAEMAERGGVFLVATSGRRIAFHPTAAQAIDAAKEGKAQRDRWHMAYARQSSTAHRKGGRRILTGKKRKEAEIAWRDPKITGADAAKMFDVSVRTMHKEFGPRGTPIFGGKGRTR